MLPSVSCPSCQRPVSGGEAACPFCQTLLNFADVAVPAQTLLPEVEGYDILGVLGSGGMGVVYKARQKSLNRLVALKMTHAALPLGTQQRDELLARFRREAQIVARVRNPNVVQVHDIGEAGGRVFFALEYVDGSSLDRKLLGQPQPARAAAELVEILAKAIHEVHRAGIIHRDLKPANVLLQRQNTGDGSQFDGPAPANGEATQRVLTSASIALGPAGRIWYVPKITDFGVARRLDDDPGLTRRDVPLGTPSYMAPEQADGGAQGIGPATDVWGLGAILYEMLTGRPPFLGESAEATREMVRTRDAVPPHTLRAGVPRDLDVICLKCLRKAPSARYATARELADDLRCFLAGQPIRARPAGRLERAFRWCRRNPTQAALVGSLLAVLLLGVAGVARQLRNTVAQRELKEAALLQAEKNERDARQKAADEADARRRAQKAEGDARDRERQLEQEKRRVEQALYFSRIDAANRMWLAGRVDQAEEALTLCERELRPDLLQWEWRYLKRRCGSGMTVLPVESLRDAGSPRLVASPDGRTLVLAGGKGPVEVWTFPPDATPPTKYQVPPTPYPVTDLAFSPAEKVLAIAFAPAPESSEADRGGVQVWDLEARKERFLLPRKAARKEGGVVALAWSGNGSLLATVDDLGLAEVWDARSPGRRVLALPRQKERLRAVALTPDGKRLAAGGEGDVRIWEVPSGRSLSPLETGFAWTNCLVFTPDGRRLAAAGASRSVKVWDVGSGQLAQVLRGHADFVRCLAITDGGRYLAAGGDDRTVRVWQVEDGEEQTVLRGHRFPVAAVAFTTLRNRLASVAVQEGRVILWDLVSRQEDRSFRRHQKAVNQIAFAPDGRRLVSAGEDGLVKITDAVSRRDLLTFRNHNSPVLAVAFHPEGRLVASAGVRTQSGAGEVFIWESESGKMVCSVEEPSGRMRALAFSPDGTRLLTTGGDRGGKEHEAVVRETRTGTVALRLGGHEGAVECVAWSRDGQMATGTRDGVVRLWDGSGRLLRTIRAHAEGDVRSVTGVAFSPDGRWVASALEGDDKLRNVPGEVKVWNVETGEVRATFRGHTGRVLAVAFSPTSPRVASVGMNEVKVWEATTGREILSLSYPGQPRAVAFSPDGDLLAAGGEGWSHPGEVKVWDGRPVK